MLFLLAIMITALFQGLFVGANGDFTCPMKAPASVSPEDQEYASKPFVDGNKIFVNGIISDWTGPAVDVTSPIVDTTTGQRALIGKMAQMEESDALHAVEVARLAWNNGQGTWPQMSANKRLIAMEAVLETLQEKREEIINVLLWEICKNKKDAAAEFDRTIEFSKNVIAAFRKDLESHNWTITNGILNKIRRTAIGLIMCLGPFNYPINETYATLLPALLSGNIVILKIPTLGGLAHILTIEAFAKHLPPGTLNFVSGKGRKTMGPIMRTGAIDGLAFIGGSSAADSIIKEHPNPHRLKIFLQLEGKNPGIVMPDADLDVAAEQIKVGATSYNGQRCTAIKLVFVHSSVVDSFLPKLIERVSSLKVALPWVEGAMITPLPETDKPQKIQDWIMDAVSKGASVINVEEGGGTQEGALVTPAIMYPVDSSMKLFHEEQFGPVIPVVRYDSIEEIYTYLGASPFGQQAAIFTSNSHDGAKLVDILSTTVGRININTQCGRSPDTLPFSGRRSSALGTMSVQDTVSLFSTETVLASKHNDVNEKVSRGLDDTTKFLSKL